MPRDIDYATIDSILFFIKNVDDKDIGILLNYFTENFYNKSLFIMEEIPICNKGILLHLLLSRDDCIYDVMTAIGIIYSCFDYYNLWKNSDKKAHNKLKTLLKKSETINDITEHTGESKLVYVNDELKKVNREGLIDYQVPFPAEIKDVMHILIEDYVNDRLHFFTDDWLVLFLPPKHRFCRCFRILKQENETHFFEYKIKYLGNNKGKFVETGLKLIVNITKKQWDNAHGIKAFKKIHEELIKVVTYEPEICNWCNPDVNTKTRHRCDNCMNLFQELKKYQSTFNYAKDMHKIDYNNRMDIKDIRDERKEIIRVWIEKSNADEIRKEELYNLLDSTFAVKRL